MRDLATDLRNYMDGFDEPLDPATLIEKAEGVTATPPRPGPSFLRGFVIGVAAAIIVMVLVGGALLVGGPFSGDQTPVVTQPNPETTVTQPMSETTLPPPSSTTATTVAPTLTIVGDGWTRRTFPGLLGSGEVKDIAAHDDTLIAIGVAEIPCRIGGGSGRDAPVCRSAAWVSQDHGETWLAIDIGRDGDEIWAVTATETGFVAVGLNEHSGLPQGVVWASPDGISWDRWTNASMRDAFVTGVAAGPNGLVASGFCTESGDCVTGVWASSDGMQWSPAHTFDYMTLMPVDVAGYENGYAVVAFGAGNVHVWTSPDGQTWHEAVIESSIQDGQPRIAASQTGIVTGARWGRLVTYYSSDGTTWRPIEVKDDAACPSPVLMDLAATAEGFLAVSACGDRAGVWVTDTGATWRLVSTEHPVFTGTPQAVLADHKGAVMVGSPSQFWTYPQAP